MNIAIRILKWLGIIAFALGAIFLLIIFNFDSLERAYDKWTFEHEVVIDDVYVGMPKEDILFRYGDPDEQSTEEFLIFDDYAFAFQFTDGSLAAWITTKAKRPSTTEKLTELAGPAFLEARDNEKRIRSYTYLTGGQDGVTYTYRTNKFSSAMAGGVRWRTTHYISFYAIKGTQVCPGEICPYDLEQEETPLKEQWVDKTVWDFIDENDL